MNRDDAAALPDTLTAGGVQREITVHLRDQALIRSEITAERLADVLNNWVIRGVRYDEKGIPSVAYLGWVEHRGAERLMRVGVSMDDRRIATAFVDGKATDKLNDGDIEYFRRNYQSPEVRS